MNAIHDNLIRENERAKVLDCVFSLLDDNKRRTHKINEYCNANQSSNRESLLHDNVIIELTLLEVIRAIESLSSNDQS